MKIKAEHLIGVIAIGLGLLTFILTSGFPSLNVGSGKAPGPAFFPNIIAVFLIIVGIMEVFEAKDSERVIKLKITEKRSALNIVGVVIGIIFYILFLNKLGFIITTFLFCFGIMYMLRVGILKGLGVALILVIALTLIFRKLFHLPLPSGIL